MPLLYLERPAVLLALGGLPVLALLWWTGVSRLGRALSVLGRTSGPAGRHWGRGSLRLIALASIIFGLAGPAAVRRGRAASTATPVVFILDVSDSMAAPDASPSRLAAGREAVRALCRILPSARTALVAAAGDSAVVCPLTADRAAFLNLLGRARTNWFGQTGSRLLPALRRSAALLGKDAGGAGAMVLVSDGEFHDAPSPQEVESICPPGALLHTLCVGTQAGAVLPAGPDREAVVTRARPMRMAAWAEACGGRAWSTGAAGRRIPQKGRELVPARLAGAVARERGRDVRLSPYLYLGAAVLLALERLLLR